MNRSSPCVTSAPRLNPDAPAMGAYHNKKFNQLSKRCENESCDGLVKHMDLALIYP